MNKLYALIAISSLFAACQPAERHITPGFYYWQTSLDIDQKEQAYLDSVACKKLYIKVLDIGVNPASGLVEPYARLQTGDTASLRNREIVPVIFITNAVFKTIGTEKADWLAQKTIQALAAFPFQKNSREIQFDCDWTASSRDAFFLFLKKVQQALPNKSLSATIRLHQYKFPKQTGVPPVSRGMLMFYNTGDIESENTSNSIFQIADAEKYVQGAAPKYPLPLDLALPLFSWTLVYREGEFWKIINGTPADLKDTARFEMFQPDTFRYAVKQSTFLAGHYLRPGDHLRVEALSEQQLMKAAQLAAQTDLADDATLAFFYLDTAVIRNYPPKLIRALCQKTGFKGD
ncbi:MAG: hypothetical protein JNM22_02110 [Saprospiraceae bacterium]|nr:hypothetical protein [Saprospiraceae bacterium]